MKKKGNKRRVNSSKKRKIKSFSFFDNRIAPIILTFVFLALMISLSFFTTGYAISSGGVDARSFLDRPASLKFPNAMRWLDIGNTWRDVIVYFIVLAIIFVMLLDMLLLTSIFSGWVSGVVAAGISIIAVLTNIIRQISIWLITLTAGLGALGGFIEIIIAIVVFIGLALGSPKIALWAARRRAQKEEIKAIKGSGQAGAAIAGLKMIQREFKK